jgi:mRNA interferase MazF
MNSLITNLKQGDLVVTDVLFSEQIGIKRRLALVISNSKYNKTSEDIVIVKVTSSNSNTLFDIKLDNNETINKTLKKPSTIMVDFPMTIYKNNIYSIPDSITQSKLEEVKLKIKDFYNL